jgi:hypothetical protein
VGGAFQLLAQSILFAALKSYQEFPDFGTVQAEAVGTGAQGRRSTDLAGG